MLSGDGLLLHVVEFGDGLGVIAKVDLKETRANDSDEVNNAWDPCARHRRKVTEDESAGICRHQSALPGTRLSGGVSRFYPVAYGDFLQRTGLFTA